jgi:hypothetical protein
MPLPFKKDRRAVSFVIKKLKGSDDYDNMKSHNESNAGKEMMAERQSPEKSYELGMDQAVDEMLMAFERKDSEGLKNSLKSFISLCMDCKEDEDELFDED